MKTRRLFMILVSLCLIHILISCEEEKEENDYSLDFLIEYGGLTADYNATNLPSVKNAVVEIYSSIEDWNNYKEPIYSGITDEDGKLSIKNSEIINKGFSNVDLYIFVHETSILASNWVEPNKEFFSSEDSKDLRIVIADDFNIKALRNTKYKLVDIKTNAHLISIWDTVDNCIKDNFLTIRRGGDITNGLLFIVNEGNNVCDDNEVIDTLATDGLILNNGNLLLIVNDYDHTRYGEYLNAGFSNKISDTIELYSIIDNHTNDMSLFFVPDNKYLIKYKFINNFKRQHTANTAYK